MMRSIASKLRSIDPLFLSIGIAMLLGILASVLRPLSSDEQLDHGHSAALITSVVATTVQDEVASSQDEAEFTDEDIEFFETKVRPLLVEHCFECHGPDSDLEGGLSLASRRDAIQGGDSGPALELGNVSESLLLDAINYGDVYQMPPESKLPDSDIEVLTEWVERGAPWTPGDAEVTAERMKEFDLQSRRDSHWCWQPIVLPPIPKVADASWARDPLDHFVLARLEASGISPNGEADKSTWLRRVHFDLVGLPPSPDVIEAFLADESPTAHEKIVDDLLASDRFGERWARHWMDLMRYAETCGHEFDYPIPHAWRYRDYLIRAFNQDVHYDDFIREHIAGDLIAEPRRHPEEKFNESLIATGFWFLGEATHAPVDVKGDEAGRVDNQIDVMSKTFLGLTIACARCHDHKFDAISTKDYYSLAGFLQSSRRQEGMLDPNQRIELGADSLKQLKAQGGAIIERHLAKSIYGNATDSESFFADLLGVEIGDGSIDLSQHADLMERWKNALQVEEVDQPGHPAFMLRRVFLADASYESKQQAFAQALNAYQARLDAYEKSLESTVLFHDFRTQGSAGWFVTGNAFERATQDWGAMYQSAPAAERIPTHPNSLHSGALSTRLYGVIRSPTFELTHPRIHYRAAAKGAQIRLIIDGYTMDVYNGLLFGDVSKKNVDTEGKYRWVQQAGDIGRYVGQRAHIEIIDHGDGFAAIDEIRFSHGGPPIDPPSHLSKRLLEEDEVTVRTLVESTAQLIQEYCEDSTSASPSTSELVEWMLANELLPEINSLQEKLSETDSKFGEIHQGIPSPQLVQAMTDGTGENEYVFVRGNHRVMGDEAPRQLPEAIGADWIEIEAGSGRLQLAEKLASPSNPMTSRVIVNRIWHHLFGRGIVASVDNFGVLGQAPTHPELLDFLAVEFTSEHDWSIKSMIKRLVLSQTYRMSSRPNSIGAERDPNNLLLYRARIRRLQGEAIRDSMLAISQQLDTKMHGPSVPVHLTPFMQGRGRPGRQGPVDGNRRRSIYLEVRRNFLSPMMLAFDTPIPFNAMGRRNVSNVPAQALILMNDPFVHLEAEKWAERIMEFAPNDSRARIQRMYIEAYGRDATEEEIASTTRFVEIQAETLNIPDENLLSDKRLWTDVAHVLFNVKEFIYIN